MKCQKCGAKLVAWECVICKHDNTPNDSKPNYEKLYHELLMNVETKIRNETRHETALRYIAEMERKTINGA